MKSLTAEGAVSISEAGATTTDVQEQDSISDAHEYAGENYDANYGYDYDATDYGATQQGELHRSHTDPEAAPPDGESKQEPWQPL